MSQFIHVTDLRPSFIPPTKLTKYFPHFPVFGITVCYYFLTPTHPSIHSVHYVSMSCKVMWDPPTKRQLLLPYSFLIVSYHFLMWRCLANRFPLPTLSRLSNNILLFPSYIPLYHQRNPSHFLLLSSYCPQTNRVITKRLQVIYLTASVLSFKWDYKECRRLSLCDYPFGSDSSTVYAVNFIALFSYSPPLLATLLVLVTSVWKEL